MSSSRAARTILSPDVFTAYPSAVSHADGGRRGNDGKTVSNGGDGASRPKSGRARKRPERLEGRFQSRPYLKLLEDGSERRVAYEVSAAEVEALEIPERAEPVR